MTAAIQRIRDLLSSEYDICLWMAYLRGDEFESRLAAVLFSVLATPSSNIGLRETYEQTRRILQVHAYGLVMLSAMGCTKLRWKGNNFTTDCEGIDPLPEEHLKEWGSAVSFTVSELR